MFLSGVGYCTIKDIAVGDNFFIGMKVISPGGLAPPMKCGFLQPAHDEGAEGRDGRRVAVVVHDLAHVLDKGV